MYALRIMLASFSQAHSLVEVIWCPGMQGPMGVADITNIQ